MTPDYTITTLIAAWVFVFTITFAYSNTLFSKTTISSYLKCVAGGIILSTMIFHIVPDLYEEESFAAQLSAGVSFLILFVIDKLYLEQAGHTEEEDVGECEKNGREKYGFNDDSVEMSECEKGNVDENKNYEEYQRYETGIISKDDNNQNNNKLDQKINVNNTNKENNTNRINKDIAKKHTHSHDSLSQNATIGKAIVFVVALSVHSFPEGLGVSTKKEEKLSVYLFGLVGHKWIEAFALGVSVASAPFRRRTAFLLILFYSSLTTIEILTGMFLMKIENSIVEFILVGAATRSFFYIGFVEMLNSEFNEEDEMCVRRIKLGAICGGFGIMTVVFKVHHMIGGSNK